MLDRLISSLLLILLSIVPHFGNQTDIDDKKTTIIFTGDIMLGRSVMGEAMDNNDSFYPFRKTSEFLKSSDITFSNLENPIVGSCKRHVGGFKFCTTPEIAKGLSDSGIDVVSLANNHSSNYGESGIKETTKHLNSIGIKAVGLENLEIIEKNNTKFGFLGFNYTFTTKNLENDLKIIQNADPLVDVLIVGNHWGEEYKETANQFQVSTAKKMIDSGADVIIGHHPHWVQNYEEYKGKPIYYSLGNFIFDQMWSEETKKGLLVKMTFDGNTLVKTEELNTYTPLKGQPVIQ